MNTFIYIKPSFEINKLCIINYRPTEDHMLSVFFVCFMEEKVITATALLLGLLRESVDYINSSSAYCLIVKFKMDGKYLVFLARRESLHENSVG